MSVEWYVQENVFVNVIASIQYRVQAWVAEKASDAFYKLSDTQSQILQQKKLLTT